MRTLTFMKLNNCAGHIQLKLGLWDKTVITAILETMEPRRENPLINTLNEN